MGQLRICTELQGGTWQTYLRAHLTEEEVAKLDKSVPMPMLSAPQLKYAVGAARAVKLLNLVRPIMPEIDLKGQRRCVYIHDNGVRCSNYIASGMCGVHMPAVKQVTKFFKSQTLNDQYKAYLKDPRQLSLNRELAMLRLMMAKLMDMVVGDNVPIQIIEHVTVLTRDIKSMVEATAKLNQLTPETVDNILNACVKVLEEYVPADKLEEAAAKIQELSSTDPVSDIQFEPGNNIEIDGEVQTIAAVDGRDIQKRALLEHYGPLLDPENLETLKGIVNEPK